MTIVGQEGVELSPGGRFDQARLLVRTEGVRFVSLHLPRGAHVREGWRSSLTMEKCTSTGNPIAVAAGASLVMEDCRVFAATCGNLGGVGVYCEGTLEATRCIFEDHSSDGVHVVRGEAKLMECTVQNNGRHGLSVTHHGAKAFLEGGTISGNKQHGVLTGRAKVIVAAAEHCEQTVSSGNGEHSWATQYGGKIAGLAEGIQAHGIQAHFADALTFA